LCQSTKISVSSLSFTTNEIFVDESASFENEKPPKPQKASNGVKPGDDGKHGAPGLPSPTISIVANQIMTGSGNVITYNSIGGDGGDGGDGAKGLSHAASEKPHPTNLNSLKYWTDPQTNKQDGGKYDCHHVSVLPIIF
jgi:hypothetical protein